MKYNIDINKCYGCQACIDACPIQAIYEGETVCLISDDCVGCGQCINNCPMDAIYQSD